MHGLGHPELGGQLIYRLQQLLFATRWTSPLVRIVIRLGPVRNQLCRCFRSLGLDVLGIRSTIALPLRAVWTLPHALYHGLHVLCPFQSPGSCRFSHWRDDARLGHGLPTDGRVSFVPSRQNRTTSLTTDRPTVPSATLSSVKFPPDNYWSRRSLLVEMPTTLSESPAAS